MSLSGGREATRSHVPTEERHRHPLPTASHKAYQAIKSSIVSGRFKPGHRLKEEQLGELCGVSRTPIREALRRLHQEGLVQIGAHKGAQVADWSAADLAEVFSLRGLLEGHAAERAASRITQKDLDRLRRYAARMEDAIDGRPANYQAIFLEANTDFHGVILGAAASPRLVQMMGHVLETPLMLRTFERYSDEDIARSMGHHAELIDALRAHDGDWARSIMQSHLSAAHRAFMV